MAFRILRVCGQITNKFNNIYGMEIRTTDCLTKSGELLALNPSLECFQRSTSFFTKNNADTLWKSVTSVSNAGKRRGRGKGAGAKFKRNLNIGQEIGKGKVRMLWPGLNSPIIQGRSLVQQQRLPDDPDYERKIIAIRDASNRYNRKKVHPLERGWTSKKLGGRKMGPPDPIGDETFEGFETIILEHKIVGHMTGNMGRKRTFSCFVITGNKNGLAGIALGKASDSAAAIRDAKNSAGLKLFYTHRCGNHTVFHDFHSQFGRTQVFVSQKNEGFGLVCHRAIKAACEVIGIKNLYAKIEGPTNVQNIIKAFLIGLLRQKTHQELVESKKLHLVEFRKENAYFPRVIASPSIVRKEEEIPSTETIDFTQYVMGGKIVLKKKKNPSFITREPGWIMHLRKAEKLRNKEKLRIKLRVHYGEVKSYLTDEYPEAKPQYWKKKRVEEEIEQ